MTLTKDDQGLPGVQGSLVLHVIDGRKMFFKWSPVDSYNLVPIEVSALIDQVFAWI